jgi:hypothetical protein
MASNILTTAGTQYTLTPGPCFPGPLLTQVSTEIFQLRRYKLVISVMLGFMNCVCENVFIR